MTKRSISWNSERILSLSAMLISVITLLIFIYQTNLMRRQNYLSIMPYLLLSTTRDKSEQLFSVSLKNHGVGPAIIESTTLIYQGKAYHLRDYNFELLRVLTVLAPELDSLHTYSSSSLDKGIAIPANYTYQLLESRQSAEAYELLNSTIDKLLANGLDYEIIYRSIQEERWVIRLQSDGPKRLD